MLTPATGPQLLGPWSHPSSNDPILAGHLLPLGILTDTNAEGEHFLLLPRPSLEPPGRPLPPGLPLLLGEELDEEEEDEILSLPSSFFFFFLASQKFRSGRGQALLYPFYR